MAIQQIDLTNPLRLAKPVTTADEDKKSRLTLGALTQDLEVGGLTIEKIKSEIAAARAKVEQEAAAKAILAQGGDPESTLNNLVQGGMLSPAEEFAKIQASRGQAKASAAQIANTEADNLRASETAAAARAREERERIEKENKNADTIAQEMAGVMIPGSSSEDAEGNEVATFRVRDNVGAYRNEQRVIGKAKKTTGDNSTTETELAIKAANPDATISGPAKAALAILKQNRPQSTIALQTVDENGNPVTRIVPKTAGSELPAAPTTDARNRAAAAKKADPVLGRISALSEKINTGSGLLAKASGAVAKQAAKANYDDDVAEYEALISGFTPLVARSLGHTGVLTEQDVQSVKALFPKPGDSKTLRDRKIDQIKTLMFEIAEDAPATGASGSRKEQHSPSTGQYRHSLDGGKTWRSGRLPK